MIQIQQQQQPWVQWGIEHWVIFISEKGEVGQITLGTSNLGLWYLGNVLAKMPGRNTFFFFSFTVDRHNPEEWPNRWEEAQHIGDQENGIFVLFLSRTLQCSGLFLTLNPEQSLAALFGVRESKQCHHMQGKHLYLSRHEQDTISSRWQPLSCFSAILATRGQPWSENTI